MVKLTHSPLFSKIEKGYKLTIYMPTSVFQLRFCISKNLLEHLLHRTFLFQLNKLCSVTRGAVRKHTPSPAKCGMHSFTTGSGPTVIFASKIMRWHGTTDYDCSLFKLWLLAFDEENIGSYGSNPLLSQHKEAQHMPLLHDLTIFNGKIFIFPIWLW